jgi:hypothetical protein
MRPLLACVLAACALAAVPAGAYPPHTCGRVSHEGKAFVVRTHGPTCGTALRGVRTFLAHHRSLKGFRCRAYAGGDVPAYCLNRAHRFRYFFASAAS